MKNAIRKKGQEALKSNTGKKLFLLPLGKVTLRRENSYPVKSFDGKFHRLLPAALRLLKDHPKLENIPRVKPANDREKIKQTYDKLRDLAG